MLAQLVEHCTNVAEVMGSNPVQASIFSGLILHNGQVVLITAKITLIFKIVIGQEQLSVE